MEAAAYVQPPVVAICNNPPPPTCLGNLLGVLRAKSGAVSNEQIGLALEALKRARVGNEGLTRSGVFGKRRGSDSRHPLE